MGFLELARKAVKKNAPATSSTHSDLDPESQKLDYPGVNEREIAPYDDKARTAGFLIGMSGELYFATLYERAGFTAMLFIERSDDDWMAWRETFKAGERHAISIRKIAAGNYFDSVLKQAKKYAVHFKGT